MWEFSSAGRASALQAGGHRFEPCNSHQFGQVVQLVRMPACHAGGRQFEPDLGRQFVVGVGKRLSHRVVVPICVGSNPTIHPIFKKLTSCDIGVSPSGKATDSDSVMRRFESCYPSQQVMLHVRAAFVWRHSQVVRHWSAKPLFPGSNLGVASI